MWKKILAFFQKLAVSKALAALKTTDYDWKKTGIKAGVVAAQALIAFLITELGGLNVLWAPLIVAGLKSAQDYLKHR